MVGSKSENAELACKIMVRGYEFQQRDLEKELSAFGKIVGVSFKKGKIVRSKPSLASFVGEKDKNIPPPPRGESVITFVDQAREYPSQKFRMKAIAASQSLFMCNLSQEENVKIALGSSVIKV